MTGRLTYFLAISCMVCVLPSGVSGHGRLIKPPSRSSMWRYGFNNPTNYNDNQLYCGGVQVQYTLNGGRCGVCGDPYNGVRENEAGGRYANGIIVETYMKGSAIEVDVDITANHLGWIEFKLCPHNDPSTPITQTCLDRYLLAAQGTGETRKFIGSTVGVIRTTLDLPADVTCTQCVLQWRYHTGNSWGTDPVTGQGCVGCGNQEEFYGCADIAISDDGGPVPEYPTQAPDTTPAPPSNEGGDSDDTSGGTQDDQGNGASTGDSCRAAGAWTGQASMTQWCVTNCALGNCPPTHCVCEEEEEVIRTLANTTPDIVDDEEDSDDEQGQDEYPPVQGLPTCYAIGGWSGQARMDTWCSNNCAMGFCPAHMCACSVLEPEEPQDDGWNSPEDPASCESYVAIGDLRGVQFADDYCHLACSTGACPDDLCECRQSNNVHYLQCYAANDILRRLPGMNAYCQVVCSNDACPPECVCTL